MPTTGGDRRRATASQRGRPLPPHPAPHLTHHAVLFTTVVRRVVVEPKAARCSGVVLNSWT